MASKLHSAIFHLERFLRACPKEREKERERRRRRERDGNPHPPNGISTYSHASGTTDSITCKRSNCREHAGA